jgi:hypothetical protein
VTDAGPSLHEPRALPRTSSLAVGALGTSIAGFVCFWGIGGVLGIALGFAAKGAIERSDGRLTGGTLAVLGIALGALNVFVTGLAFVGLALWDFRFTGSASTAPTATPSIAIAPTAAPVPSPTRSAPQGPAASGRSSREHGTIATTVGKIHLVDLAPEDGLLAKQLEAELTNAEHAHEHLVLWTIRGDCKPCDGVAAALPDRRMQRALSDVRLVRVDVRDFAIELERLRVPIQSVPGFSLLGPESRVVDYVHGGEWDDDVAANIAPVLSEFVRGRYVKRRHPWRGGQRTDDTPL